MMEASLPRRTRIQREKREIILEAALEVFSANGFRGSTIDQIAEAASMSKPNLLYYFRRKEDIHEALMQRLLDTWLQPLRELDDIGDPLTELGDYIRRKLEMARDFPRESRLFANEILQGAPRIMPLLEGELKTLVDEKVAIIEGWMRAGRIARTDPYHLIFSIWATTQHYADFDVQVRAVLGADRGGDGRFEDALLLLLLDARASLRLRRPWDGHACPCPLPPPAGAFEIPLDFS
jgi:TetR/AcrR family transcriptional regulator